MPDRLAPVTDTPAPGFYKVALCRGGPLVPVRIWFGPPLDPDFPRALDRAPAWQCLINGARADVGRVWPHCAKHPIGRAEYRYMLARFRWAVRFAHVTGDPLAMPTQRINLSAAQPLF